MSDRFKIILAYIAICTIWGSTWLVIKIGLDFIPPFLAAGLRFSLASLILFGIIKFRKILIPLHSRALWFYLIVGLTSFSIPFALVYWAEQKVASGLTAILFAVYPLSVAIMSYLFLKNEKLNFFKVAGIVFGFSGIVTIFWNDMQIDSSLESLLGMTAIVLSAVMQSFSAVMIKKHGREISPFVVCFAPMFLSAILLLAAGLVVEDVSAIQITAVSVFSVTFLALFGSVITFVSYFWLIKRVEVVILSLTSFVTPIIAVILGIVILHEHISSQLFIGVALVLGGILLANAAEVRKFLRERVTSSK